MSILGVWEEGWIMCPAEVLAGWALPSSALRFFADLTVGFKQVDGLG